MSDHDDTEGMRFGMRLVLVALVPAVLLVLALVGWVIGSVVRAVFL